MIRCSQVRAHLRLRTRSQLPSSVNGAIEEESNEEDGEGLAGSVSEALFV